MLDYHEYTTESAKLKRIASYRTATCPIDIDITGNIIAVGDLMKSMSLVEYRPGNSGEQGELVEVARHFQASQTTAVAHIEDHTYLTSDADHNLIILERNMNGVTLEDRKRLQVTSEISLGEMVNKIRKIDVEASPNAPVIPRAFLCTV
jgi:DNA damage-binding protein 1